MLKRCKEKMHRWCGFEYFEADLMVVRSSGNCVAFVFISYFGGLLLVAILTVCCCLRIRVCEECCFPHVIVIMKFLLRIDK